MKIAVTILFIGVSLLVCALIAGVVREIVKRFKPVPPPQITSTLEFGSPDSMLTYEYPGDDKLQGVIDEFGKSGYTLTQIYGPSDSYPLQAIRLGFANGFMTHKLGVGEHPQYLTPIDVKDGDKVR